MEQKVKTTSKINHKIGFIGAGNMARALGEGMIRQGLVSPSQMYVSAPHLEKLNSWRDIGVHVTNKNGQVAEEADIIFLSVKPHILAPAIANMLETMSRPSKIINKLFVSVLAGITLETLENILTQFEGSRVIRVMPNTPVMVGEGCTVYCPGQNSTEEDIQSVCSIIESTGVCTLVPESMINACGALAGCGPAYVYLMCEALSDGGVKMGIPRAMATQFAAHTLIGAAKMVLETGKHPGQLKDEVCSPGGATIAGVHALEKGGVRAALMDAIEQASKRAEQLGHKK